ncbi:glutamate synthase subunit beta [Tuberibacillus sp. Marseille-P3662]|uniref:glutamate synthase subunit beta n=1 Tax=Tuberibacillus sp. Marseille-P3662 TaxID=1965358 RepID=UPI000A1CDBCB|nr:glutamate synthase subunit beta [Tuberibacillus sp. Marseille-P3662]
MNIPRVEQPEEHPSERISHWDEYQQSMPQEDVEEQASRCMDCGTPFCQTGIEWSGVASGCPLYNVIPEWNELVSRGKWREAFDRLMKTNNFPEFTGRVCPAPCEGACTAALPTSPVNIKTIEQAIVDKAYQEGWIKPMPPHERTSKQVAVVGSGPAGLTAADELNKAGHHVTVYERDDRLGGLLMYGIPNMKLDKKWVNRRIAILEDEGIRFKTGVSIGEDVSFEKLETTYDAVIVCTGAQKHRDLPIEGRELNGVHFAMDYLKDSTKTLLDDHQSYNQKISAKNKNVVVIGGGDTGADCVASALRQEAKSIVQFGKHPALPETRPLDNPWPEYPQVFSLDYAYKETKVTKGEDPREYSIQTQRFVGDEDGKIIGLETVRIVSDVDEAGQSYMRECENSKEFWPVDLVLIAIGFVGVEQEIDHAGLAVNQRGSLAANRKTYQTNRAKVFGAGDARRGQSLVVNAIREGREAADSCHQYLMETAQLTS